MDVSRASFPFEVVKIINHVLDSHFISIDLELSGIATRQTLINASGKQIRKAGSKLNLQEFYQEAKEAAERYQVLQIGLTVVEEDVQRGEYIVRPYNFYLDPVPSLSKLGLERSWSFSSGGSFSIFSLLPMKSLRYCFLSNIIYLQSCPHSC